MNTIYEFIVYVWDGDTMMYIARNSTLAQADAAAAKLGYVPKCWYKPSTWGNYCNKK